MSRLVVVALLNQGFKGLGLPAPFNIYNNLYEKLFSFLDRTTSSAAQQYEREVKDGANTNLMEYLDSSTLQQLENMQVISPPSAASREQPKGTQYLEIANKVR